MKAETNGVAVAEPAPKAKPAKASKAVNIIRLNVRPLGIRLVGTMPLICNRWSEKAREQIRRKQMKEALPAQEAKNPQACFEASLYPYPGGGYGFPAIAFKAAAVDACSHVDGITKVEARGAFHINTDLVKIIGEPTMREDMVKISMGTADLRYRGEFREWRTEFLVEHNANVLSAEQIINLFETAGFAIGVGEWRPQRDGSFGRFKIDRSPIK